MRRGGFVLLVLLLERFPLLPHLTGFFRARVEDDLEAALQSIGGKAGDLVLRHPVIGVLRMVAEEVDRVEFALGGADAAADALIGIDDRGAAA